ncbi:UDP-N-acetylglucosamine 1-carboxyvinyltransferase [Candidatus Kuenenbacteria bacterium HGW-Kuenenbacteria-1]|uniref:UDP-N-acetylglucosamine 1-carboxyvinyltransferase n=1 Tax=Candidatus Kuenenbacteria bacterium HGW-Kuenenbacteria-1 TaxID=2013812 RepID=A0A2N1UPB2_9BACT|nr:MAG: UDP-N-acetylglucosamine 1-carboxyvinyltransferase [Candidatus Kuenenbacteria bacterium HGW-Kuenenbacteria-1]
MKYIIQGKRKLNGEIKVNGAKNLALKALAASFLFKQDIIINNVPDIEDIKQMLEIIKDLGAKVKKINDYKYKISTKNINKIELSSSLAPKLRASIVLIGPMLARFGEAKLPYPGGCIIGMRPIDIFIDGFKALGVEIEENKNGFYFKVKKLKGAKFIFPIISVTATETLMMAATLAKGKTTLVNSACEPEISALANYLNSCGAKISGAGTSTIIIEGVNKLLAKDVFNIIPDRIEAGTFAIMAAATKSDILIKNCDPNHLEIPLLMLKKIGVNFETKKDYIHVFPSKNLKATNIVTHEYPGFVTDLQAPFTVLLTQAQGISLIHETIYEGRLFYIDKLNRMGAHIILCDPHRAIVNGLTKLYGKKVESPDIRAGMAIMIAALIAEGETEIDNIYQINRGYEKIDERLQKLGAEIKRQD